MMSFKRKRIYIIAQPNGLVPTEAAAGDGGVRRCLTVLLSVCLPWFLQKQQLVMEECAKLAQYVESHTPDNGKQPEKMAAVQLLTFLGQSFSTLVDIALGILVGVRTSHEYIRTSTRTCTLRLTMIH